MSTDQTESGHIQFTKVGGRQVLKKIKNVYSNWQDLRYRFALELYDQLKVLPKAEQNPESARKLVSFEEDHHQYYRPSRMTLRENSPFSERLCLSDDDLWTINHELFRGKGSTLCKPRMNAFPKPKSADKEISFYYHGCSIELDEENCLKWHVEQNNHSVDSAWLHPITQIIMVEYLGQQYKWRRGEGGKIFSYSEDHEDGELHLCNNRGFGNEAPKHMKTSEAARSRSSSGMSYGVR